MKSENEKFRQFKLERDRELCRLKENERKQKNQMIRMERLHVRQQAALKRKLEEAANVNKRLKVIQLIILYYNTFSISISLFMFL